MTNIQRFEFADFAIDWVEYNGEWYAPFDQVWKYFEYASSQRGRYLLEDDDLYSPQEGIKQLALAATWITRKGFLVLAMRSDKPQAKTMRRTVVDFFDKLLTKGYVDLTGERDASRENELYLSRENTQLRRQLAKYQQLVGETMAESTIANALERSGVTRPTPAQAAKFARRLQSVSFQKNESRHRLTPTKYDALLEMAVEEGLATTKQALKAQREFGNNLRLLEEGEDGN